MQASYTPTQEKEILHLNVLSEERSHLTVCTDYALRALNVLELKDDSRITS